MTAKKYEGGGLDCLGAVDLTKPSPEQPAFDHTYEGSSLDLLGAVDIRDLRADELKTKKEQALRGLDLLGAGEPIDWAWFKDGVFQGVRLTSTALEILSDPKERPSDLRRLLRALVQMSDLLDKRK
jgi:hypothetical protein